MRPSPGQAGLPGRLQPDDNERSLTAQPDRPQMTYILADEASLDASLANQSRLPAYRVRDSRKSHPNDSADAAAGTSVTNTGRTAARRDSGSRPSSSRGQNDLARDDDVSLSRADSPAGKISVASNPPFSQPMTPVLLGQSGPTSASSCLSSRRDSFVGSTSEDVGSQVLPELDELGPEASSSSMMDSGSAPQLVMPSIKMPSRRPFTTEGRNIGRLKVLVAGDTGTGKTSLIKAIVQSCQHIVHVDPINPTQISIPDPKTRGKRQAARPDRGTTQITEIYASTKPYPEWWSDLDDVQILRRRKSLGDTVLDRNICFVDTPGFGKGASPMDVITPVSHYVSAHLDRMRSDSLSDTEMLNMLGGDGGAQVDVVLYLIGDDFKPADVEYLRHISPVTNVIPVLARADLLQADQIEARKDKVQRQLQEANVRTFAFSTSSTTSSNAEAEPKLPYAISSATGSDHETMDASLLMSPDYVQPLVESDLADLVDQIFSSRGASWLRHAAARKYIQWRRTEGPSKPMDLYRPLSHAAPAAGPLMGGLVATSLGAPTSFALARIADHAQREERLAQIRLANWAAELQRSLANERERYEALAHGERALWLTNRLNECVQDGTLVSVRSGGGGASDAREKAERALRRRRRHAAMRTAPHQDPLGLLELAADLKAKKWIALEILGGLGVLGGLALWFSRQYGHLPVPEWVVDEWTRFWAVKR